jgi:hypothetical protein
MLSNKEKADKLREAIALLMDVDNLQQAALGASDICYENHIRIQDLIADFECDVEEFEQPETL